MTAKIAIPGEGNIGLSLAKGLINSGQYQPEDITISGLNEMEHNGFSPALIKGLLASYRKIENLNGTNPKT